MSVSEDQTKTAKSIFLSALEIEADSDRQAYLDAQCGDHESLRQEVNRLLAHQQEVGSFLESPPQAVDFAPTVDHSVGEKPGSQIGPYKLLQQIGEGGMGIVYMAEQKHPVKRRVALKIIKPGMDTQQVIARFEAERQALAMMDHPNIAKVLDAGATDAGRPYFVMELVNGIPVTEFCDQQHLTPKERLTLFIPICQAVQHAHQKGIIHRDLKPSNVLVALYDGQPVPKVIDFGVAKATTPVLTEKTMFTWFGQIVGTLEYMSPEQAQRNQLDIDTRSDVYSLGVLLYELLTGDTPFDRQRLRSAALDEMLRIIREEEPPKPSTRISSSEMLPSIAASRHIESHKLHAIVRGELDWIVMKALEKDRARRYETASKFAEDIGNYLNNEPVHACPPSAAYRLLKFAHRNRPQLAAVGVLSAALLVTAFLSTWLYMKEAEKNRLVMELAIDKTISLAENCESEEMYEQAVESYQEVLKLLQLLNVDPDDARFIETRARLADAYRTSNDLDAAIGEYESLLERRKLDFGEEHPEVQATLLKLIDVLVARSTQLSVATTSTRQDLQRAVTLAEYAVELSKWCDVPGSYSNAALCLTAVQYRRGDFSSAHDSALAWLASGARRNIYPFYLWFAAIDGRLNEKEIAVDWIMAAHNVWPGATPPQEVSENEWLYGEATMQVFGSTNAPNLRLTVAEKEQVYSRLLKKYPRAPKLRRLRGYCRIQLGQWQAAASDFDVALRQSKVPLTYYEACHSWMLWHYGQLADFAEVQRHLFSQLDKTDQHAEDERSIAAILCLVTPGDEVDADRIYQLFGPNSLERALAAFRSDRNSEAIRLLESQLGRLETSSTFVARLVLARVFLAMAYEEAERHAEAREELSKAREILLAESPWPGHAKTDKYISYYTSAIWCEPLGVLPEAERMIDGELSSLSQELIEFRTAHK